MKRVIFNIVLPLENPNEVLPGFYLHFELVKELKEIEHLPCNEMQFLEI